MIKRTQVSFSPIYLGKVRLEYQSEIAGIFKLHEDLTCSMLIDLLRHAWTSVRRVCPRLSYHSPKPVEKSELELRQRLMNSPADLDAWYGLGLLLYQNERESSPATDHHPADTDSTVAFWANTRAAGLAHQASQYKCALTLYQRALALNASCAGQILTNMGVILKELVRIPEAIQCYQQSLATQPDYAETHYNLGLTLYEVGNTEEAERHLRRAIELNPNFAAAHSTLLCIYGLTRNHDADRLFAEHRQWAKKFADSLMPNCLKFENVLSHDRRLTIGYVSADLREHSMRFFIEPVLAHHDRNAFRVLCYDNWQGEDATNIRLRQYADGWLKINQMNDEDVTRQIRRDRVDILIDLSGHTTGNRLLAFARKPAPVQATWLGYMCTTGMQAMDYHITDAYLDPPGQTEKFYSEKLIRISYAAAFSAAADSPPVNVLPAISNEFVTFASLNNYTKIGDAVVTTWTRLLLELPSAHLLIVVLGGDDPAIQDAVRARFIRAAGSHSNLLINRINICGRRPLGQFLKTFHQIDIALDPFPHCGGTTSLHTLWMGVPIITIEGDSELSRSTSGMIKACGLGQLIATDQESYIELAVTLARDIGRLANIRGELRGRMAASSYSNAEIVTRSLESAYRSMWSDYVIGQATETA